MAPLVASNSSTEANDRAEKAGLSSSWLSGLQDPRETKVLDIIDTLGQHDVHGELELPQLVVCGKQSSGKSSVLEAIARIPFPKGEMMCTKFATEYVHTPRCFT